MIDDKFASQFVDEGYIAQAADSRHTGERRVQRLLEQRRLPASGWSDLSIERLLMELASMDSNNHENNVGAGEREGRVFSALVRSRHWGLAHGIGRSGDVGAVQPKAAGSSLLCKLVEGMVRHALELSQCRVLPPQSKNKKKRKGKGKGKTIQVEEEDTEKASLSLDDDLNHDLQSTAASSSSSLGSQPQPTEQNDAILQHRTNNKLFPLVLPTATGLTITLTLLALRAELGAGKTHVVWPRIDQKSCLKAILAAGLTPVVVENALEGDELRTDLGAVEAALAEHGDAVLCVITTTSCFAPRAVDRVVEVAAMCAARGVHHVVNNAYGLQSGRIGELLSEAMRQGRVDAFVQSTDKNFLVPVGGAVVVSSSKSLVDKVSRVYPGRASVSPILDLFVTLLSMGCDTYQQLLRTRKSNFAHLRRRLAETAAKHGERLLDTPNNPISLAMTLSSLQALPGGPSQLGSMLYRRCCSGHRVVVPSMRASVDHLSFTGYGAHHSAYPVPYLTAACALGMTIGEIDTFIDRLDRTLAEAQTMALTK
ncbi:MAG: O-phosphoseryl-tRNA(Sec) selenium transferase [archaeon]|nr:O-phosphoseryl-tRNA(Sec) selenium transferase [archaeon]